MNGGEDSENHVVGGLYETEAQRLQREADEYTKNLEHEKKTYLILQDQYKTQGEVLNEYKAKIKEKIPDETKEHKDFVARQSLRFRLANERVRLNDTIGKNKQLKENIDIMRKEISFAKDSIETMQSQIAKLRQDATNCNKEAILYGRAANETNNQILALKSKHEVGKDVFEIEIKKLQERLKERDESIEEDSQEKAFGVKKDSQKQGAANRVEMFENPILILKLRLDTVINQNKEKKKLLDQYVRNARIIEEAFNTIKEGTGITNIDEIVTTFCKAEEQNYSLYGYEHQLSQENDVLEENNKFLDMEIARYQELAAVGKQKLRSRIDEMSDHVEGLNGSIKTSLDEVGDVQEEFKQMQGYCKKMVELFREGKFSAKVATQMQYNDDELVLNENNIIQYLAELEEYISSLITYVAYQKGDPNAAISSLPLEMLTKKEDNREKLQIEVPYDTNRVDGARTDAGDDDEPIADSKTLYKRFIEQVEKNQVQFNKVATGKQSNHPGPKSGDAPGYE